MKNPETIRSLFAFPRFTAASKLAGVFGEMPIPWIINSVFHMGELVSLEMKAERHLYPNHLEMQFFESV